MPRFYLPDPLAVGAVVNLPDAVAHHINVVRLAAGAEVTLFNGTGGEYTAALTSIERKRVSATVTAHHAREVELAYPVTLAQALPEASKMDWIIEKAIELGAAAFVPLAAQRCVVRLSAERAEKRRAHWQAIIVSASEQSGRNRLATLAALHDYPQWIAAPVAAGADAGQRIILSPRATLSLADWARQHPPQAVTLIIGPEGGLTEAEETAAVQNGALALAMGPRILRTETAGLAALAALNALWGGM
jgi:16S rRNA (uracil1498-N3)-methyltransferase